MRFVCFLLSIVAGIFLYWLRNRSRLLYGGIQVAAAVLLLYLFFFPMVFSIGVGGEGYFADFLTDTVSLFAGPLCLGARSRQCCHGSTGTLT